MHTRQGRRTGFLAAAALASASLSMGGGASAQVSTGDVPSYTFRAPVVGGLEARGLSRLEDLRGRPVLVEYWGTR